MTIRLESDHADWRLPPESNIYQAAFLKEELQALLAHGLPIRCQLDEVQEIDCAGLQLLLVARQECVRQGIALSFGAPSVACDEALRLVGLQELPGVAA